VTARPEILVLAGVNGAGKSSIAGAALERHGGAYYNPDRATLAYIRGGLAPDHATSRAWNRGRVQLERAIALGRSYAFETTLGGRTITSLLLQAARGDHRVRVWYAGLSSPALHLQRIRARVARGGHDIPEPRVRTRWTSSRENLVRLLPHLAELDVYDNSFEADPSAGVPPRPRRVLYARDGVIIHLAPPLTVPGWAKPIVATALTTWGETP
jgi:predicted ABC-type ATPase